MSAKEAKMLDELRAKELKALTDSEYQTIRTQVETDGIRALRGSSAQIVFAALRKRDEAMKKAVSVAQGDMVSWDSSGGTARGKVVRIVRDGKINVPDSSFEINGTEDDPAVLIQLYRDGKPTDTKVGHKMSTLKKNFDLAKHGNHDQRSHGKWADETEGEYEDNQGKHPAHKKPSINDDSEGEFGDISDDDDMEAMDMMDILRPPKITPSQRIPADYISPYSIKPRQRNRG